MTISWKQLNNLTTFFGDSFYIIDLAQFTRNYQNFLNAFQIIYPKSQIAYSYKTNYTPRLCQLAEEMKGYAEVVSGMEYELALRIGVAPERIIFNGPYKQKADFEQALLNNSIVNIDSAYEVQYICELSSQYPQKMIRVGIRCNFVIGTESPSRFGFDINNATFQTSINVLRNLPNCKIIGIHCHFLPPERSAEGYRKIAQQMINLALTKFAKDALEFIDLGGGFFSAMPTELQQQFSHSIPTFSEYGYAIASEFKRAFPDNKGPELILEPGISLTADTTKFVTKIIDIKTQGEHQIALAAASRYDIKPTLSDRNLPITVFPAPDSASQQGVFDIVGSTCMENDFLHHNYSGKLGVNDYIVFDNVGAYTNVLRPPFINFASPVLSIDAQENIEIIRRRETLNDIFSTYTF
ncbi:MAG: hypothetical protein K9L22_00425 [Methylococcaceae bacterium]|nr:hypothetical protein [Methylococcaceae bacterium]